MQEIQLQSDRTYDDFVRGLKAALREVAERESDENGVDLYARLPASDEQFSIDDEFGPLSAVDEPAKAFRSAMRHIDYAERARAQGLHEVAWSRVAFASRMVGRIMYLESAELKAKRRKEVNVALKAKAIELLSCMRPAAGWNRDTHAYRGIADALGAYSEEQGGGKGKPLDFVDLLPQWKQNDPFVRAAVIGNSSGRVLEAGSSPEAPA